MSFPIICTLTDVALVVRSYWCLKFVEFLNSQKSSFLIFPLLKGLMETFTRFIHTLRLMCVKFVYFYIYMYSPLGRWGSQNLALGEGTYILTCFSGERGEGDGYIESGNHFPFKELEGAIRYLRVALYFLIPPYTFFKSYRLG